MKEKSSLGQKILLKVPMRIFLPSCFSGGGFETSFGRARKVPARPCEGTRPAGREPTFLAAFFRDDTFRCQLSQERV